MDRLENSLFDMTGLRALVTGSSRGIGRATAERFAQHGAQGVVSGRKIGPAEETAAAINATFGRPAAQAVAANIADRDSLAALIDESVRIMGGIDVLVCNAAIHPYVGPAMETPDSVMRKMMDANVMGNHWLCQMVLPGMADRGFGRIVMVSSIAGHMGSGTFYSYSISKAADMEMARCLAAEYGARNIRVNVIAPGTVKTSMAAAVMNDEALMRREMRRNTTGRLGEPDGSAGVAVMLAAPAGAYLNGQVIDVDDGFIMSY